jgi:lipoprotein-anchoring transpeptidase ErfK/SrfK
LAKAEDIKDFAEDFTVRRTEVQTIKTAIVVVLLLFVLYGGYVALNSPDTPMSEELQNLVSVGETSADVAMPPPFQPSSPVPTASGAAEDPFKKFASLPAPSFAPPAKDLTTPPALPDPTKLAPPNIPEIPEIDIPDLGAPGEKPSAQKDEAASGASDRKVNAQETSVNVDPRSKGDPGFGLALPSSKGSDVPLLPKPTSSALPASPNLDLPSLHGDAQTLADATSPKSDLAPGASEPSIPASKPGRSYENAKQIAMDQVKDGDLKKALATLSLFYNATELTMTQRTDLTDLLDALAREVIFSRRHMMDFAFVVAAGDTWDQIAAQYDVPVEILARINGLEISQPPPAGTNLKVIPGPFRAEVNLNSNEMTVFVGDLYAGRYPCSFGQEPLPIAGVYQVQQKALDRNYYSSNGANITAEDPSNPYGGFWIDLGQSMCIHGSSKLDGSPTHLGCISLSPLDANDVYGMLGVGSQVTIRR